MGIDKGWMAGSTAMLLLRLLEERDRYGYQMIEELRRRSDHTFDLKAGTLYPLLHGLEEKGWITSYQGEGGGRTRKYYHLTEKGGRELKEKGEIQGEIRLPVTLVDRDSTRKRGK